MQPLGATNHADPATNPATPTSGPITSQAIAAPPQPAANAPQADVDVEELQVPPNKRPVVKTRRLRTAGEAHVGAKGTSTWTMDDVDDEDDDEEFFKREIDSDIGEIGANTLVAKEPNKKDVWAKFSHPEDHSQILVECTTIEFLVRGIPTEGVRPCPLVPVRNRRPDDDFDEHYVFEYGKSAGDFVPKRRAMLAITEILRLPYGAAKACEVCQKFSKKGSKRVKNSQCEMNSTSCKGFKQFAGTTFNVKFPEAEYVKYHRGTYTEAMKRGSAHQNSAEE